MRVALAAPLIGGATCARAAVFHVTANPDMTFTPAHLVIYQNDTVHLSPCGSGRRAAP